MLADQTQPMLLPNMEMANESRKGTSGAKDSEIPEMNQASIEETNSSALNTTPTPEV